MSAKSVNQCQTLTPASVIKTDVPFPVAPQPSNSNGTVKNTYTSAWTPHETRKIKVEACSELMNYQFALDVFSVAGGGTMQANQLAMVHDKRGQQVVFSIGGKQRLYALCYVNNASEGWQAFDLTPPGEESVAVDAFDVLQSDSTVYLAVAMRIGEIDKTVEGQDKLNVHRILWTSFEVPELSSSGGRAQGISPSDLKWSEISNNRGDKSITAIKCAASPDNDQPFWLTVGTAATKTEAATYYTVNTYPQHQSPWGPVSLAEGSDKILKIELAILGSADDDERRPGVATLYQRQSESNQSCTVDLLDSTQTKRTATRVLLTAKLGQLRNMATSTTPWGASDVFIASEKGIGFYSSEEPERLHSTILPEVSFQQVVASEVAASVASDPTLYSKFNILAVSDEGVLYFIQGKRFEDQSIQFSASGIPIRSGVRMISSQYNATTNTNEILYVPNTANQIRHLVQDPSTCLWNESVISVRRAKGAARSFYADALVTTLTITDEDDIPVPDNFPLEVTSETVQVSVNSRSFTLTSKPTVLRTRGNFGQITIVARSHGLFGATDYRFKLTEFAKGATASEFIVQPSQRVIRFMSSIRSARDLQAVTDAKGSRVFGGVDNEKLSAAATVISQMVSAANGTASSGTNDSSAASSISWEKDSSGSVKASNDASWFDKAVNVAGGFIGDVIEGLKVATKFIVKCAIKIVGPLVRLVVKIGSKILSFALKGVGSMLKGLLGFMQEYLGIDGGDLSRWLSFFYDGTSIAKTQEVLMDFTKGALGACERLLAENRESISDMFLDARKFLQKHVDDPHPAPELRKPKKSFLSRLLNNPIIKALLRFNPMAWIIEAITDEVDVSGWKIPHLDTIGASATKHALGGVDAIATCFFNIISELAVAGGDVISDTAKLQEVVLRVLKSSLWELFDAVEAAALNIYDMIVDVFKTLYEFLTGEWKIPGLTDLWEDFSGQPFSILGYGTYIFSTLLNFSSMLVTGKLPFEVIHLVDWDVLPIPRFYSSSKTQVPPRGPHDLSVNIVQLPDYNVEKILKQPVVGSTQWITSRRVSKGLLTAFSEIIGALVTLKEIVTDPNFGALQQGGGGGSLDWLRELRHKIELSMLGLSASTRMCYTMIRAADDFPPAPQECLGISCFLDLTAYGLVKWKSSIPAVVCMQVASGLRAVAETVESGLHLSHWFHHTTEFVHLLGAFAAVGSVIAKETKHPEYAVPLTVGDLISSAAAGLGGFISCIVPEEDIEKHKDDF